MKAEDLANKWGVGKTLAKAFNKANMQNFVRSSRHLKYNALNCRFTSYGLFSSITSILKTSALNCLSEPLVLAKFTHRTLVRSENFLK